MLNHHPSPAARPLRRRFLALALGGAALLLAAGCTSPDAKRAAMIERMGPPQPALAADSALFAGALTAHASLTAAQFGGLPGPDGGKGNRPGGGMPPGGSGMRGGMGGPPGGGGMGGGPGGGGMGGPPPGGGPGGDVVPSGPLPPMLAPPRSVLRVTFTNTSAEPTEIAVLDVNCTLGNFAVRPEKLALAPGQTGELEPMHSSYTANLDALSLELRVRRNGKTELQTLNLTLAPSVPPPPR